MYADIKSNCLVAFPALGWAWSPGLAEEPMTSVRPILNVVLVELDTASGAKLSEPVVSGWPYWDKCAGRLIDSLESLLGYARAGKGGKEADASLFAYRTAAEGVADTTRLAPLIEELNQVCRVTERPSFLIVCVSSEAGIYLGLHDNKVLPAEAAFVMLDNLDTRLASLGLTGNVNYPYVHPPCVLVRGSGRPSGGRVGDVPLSGALSEPLTIQRLLHCIQGTAAQVVVDSAIKGLAESAPPGTTIELLTPTWDRIVSTAGDFLMEPTSLDFGVHIGAVSAGVSYRLGVVRENWQNFLANTWRPATSAFTRGDYGGVAFKPKLKFVVDQSGATHELEEKGVAEVRDDVAGEVEHKGKRIKVVRGPRSFKVPVGPFRLYHADITVMGERYGVTRLERFYDSSAVGASPLGPGWSVEPFSLEISKRVLARDGKTQVAHKPFLVDRRAGTRLPYLVELRPGAPGRPIVARNVASYRKLSSWLQPDLTPRPDGGYLASFADGFRIAFSEAGRIEWMGRDDTDQVTYVFAAHLLEEIRGPGGSIALRYDKQGRLTGASASTGQSVAYVLDASDRLSSVSGSESGDFAFAYYADNRLKQVGLGDQNLATNTYDEKGRMLTHQTPQGLWRFSYNDRIGRLTVTGPDAKVTDYYYDAKERLKAYGASKREMVCFNHGKSGRILQVAMAELIHDPSSGGKWLRFEASETVAPLPLEGASTTKGP